MLYLNQKDISIKRSVLTDNFYIEISWFWSLFLSILLFNIQFMI
jgi:hypothetical protein